MSDQNTINSLIGGIRSAGTEATKKKDDKTIGQDEFLTMLVAQLKNQDPLNPMQNEEFAVNLAQFSQLEKLVSIDQKLGNDQGDISSYAAYLGKEVTLSGDKVSVDDGDAGKVAIDLVGRSSNVTVELINSTGSVVQTVQAGTLEAGRHQIPLSDLDVPNGEYTMRVSAQSASGQQFTVKASPVAIVTGFVPGLTPALLVGDREISPSDITRVNTPS